MGFKRLSQKWFASSQGYFKVSIQARLCESGTWPADSFIPHFTTATLPVVPSFDHLPERSFFAWENADRRTHAPSKYLSLTAQRRELPQSSVCRLSFRSLCQFCGQTQVPVGAGDNCAESLDGNGDTHAVASELKAHLKSTTNLLPSELDDLVDNAPLFLKKLAASVKQCDSGKQNENNISSFLVENGWNEFEPFLESIGVDPLKAQELLSSLPTKLSEEQGLLSIVRTFEKLGIPRSILGEVIDKDKKLLLCTDEELQNSIHFLNDLGLTDINIAITVQKCPTMLRAEVLNDIKLLLQLLDELPSKMMIIRNAAIFTPFRLINLRKEQAVETLKFLRGMGFSEDRIDKILSKNPSIFVSGWERIIPKIQFLKDLGIADDKLGKAVGRHPGLLTYDVQNVLARKVEYFRSLGLEDHNIGEMVVKYPALLSLSVEGKFKPAVAELQTLNLTPQELKMLIHARPSLFSRKIGGAVSEVIEVLKRFDCLGCGKINIFLKVIGPRCQGVQGLKRCEDLLMQHGLSESEAKQVIVKVPTVLALPKHSLNNKIDNLTKTLGMPISTLLFVPDYLAHDNWMRTLKRQRVLIHLKSKGLLTNDILLEHIVRMKLKSFERLYVEPYPECVPIYNMRDDNSDTSDVNLSSFLKEFAQDNLIEERKL